MKQVRPYRFLSPSFVFLAGLLLSLGVVLRGDDNSTKPSPSVPSVNATASTPVSNVKFLTNKTRLWMGRSQIICFVAKDMVPERRIFSFDVDENFLHVLIPPTLMPDVQVGYIRVRPLKEGHTQIKLEGATMDVDIVTDTEASTLELTRPEIVTPVQGAVVWGRFVVGVERLSFSSFPLPSPPVLRLQDGQEIEPQIVPNQQPGPHLRYAFTVDAHLLHPGTNELVAVFKEGSGPEIVSEPVDVVALEPNAAAILSGDCKDQIQTQLPPPKVPPNGPPKVFVPPTVIPDDQSTFGSVVSSPGENPPWCMPVTIPAKGLYEMVVTARGDIGGNALPTLALMIDDANNPATTTRLATTKWQRIPVGHPITLEAGPHVLSVRFRNSFNSGPTDNRHLYLAHYELARLDQLPAPALAANDPGTTTMQDATATPLNQKPPPTIQASGTTDATAMQPKPPAEVPMQDTAAMQAKPATDPMMQALLPIGRFHIVFKDPLEGQVIANQVQINALCWWPNRDHSPPPSVDLLVNDKVVASLTNPQPQFKVDVSAFHSGENKIELQGSLPNGQRAHSTVESIVLPPGLSATNKTPPTATIVYPLPGAKVGSADAVIANVSGNQGPVRADLLIDGQPQHLDLAATNGLGPILFPLLTRNLTPGSHQLRITAKDDAGNSGQSADVDVVVTGKDKAANSTYSRAVMLLNRFGYGPEPRELAAILTMGPHSWLETRLNETIESPLEKNEQERLHAEFPDLNAVAPRAQQYLLTDANPVRARFLMWAENHFSTWINKDGAAEKSREHDRFLDLGVAPFSDLLLASATSPAMLIYLDQRNSVTKRLNENYAREIMELHTLGVDGGYTQQDVTTLADLLTGWTLADEAPIDGSQNMERTFRYNPYLNSGSPCQVLGMEFPGVALDHRFDRVLTALNMLSAHPSCALFVSRKLAEHYVSDPAPSALVNDLARIYLETGGDLRAMLLALSDEPAFWASPVRVASPVDFSVRLARMAGLANPGPVNDLASHSGMGMFDRATPDGYPDADGYFTSSNALLQRWHFAQIVQNNFLANGLIPNDWKPADHQWDSTTTQRLVDLAAVRITGDVLSPSSNDAALQLIAAAPENTDARLHLLATFLCQVPETSLR